MTREIEVCPLQCPQCRQPNDHNARFCVQCGARVRPSACATCGGRLSAAAKYCPECGAAALDTVSPPGVVPPPQVGRDPADALLAARDVDGVEDDTPAPEEMELVERVRAERASRRTLGRSALVAGVALVVLVAALVLAQRPRASREATAPLPGPATSSVADARAGSDGAPGVSDSQSLDSARLPEPTPPADSTRAASPGAAAETARAPGQSPESAGATSPPQPATARPSSTQAAEAAATAREPTASAGEAPALPERTASARARRRAAVESFYRGRGASDPAALPRAATPRPDVRVQVSQVPSEGAVDFRVRVLQPDGTAVNDADVRLRGVMADGSLVEARLDPAAEPGVYKSFLAFSPRGPRALTLRITRDNGTVEVPVGDAHP
jgi:cytoskeletal protein RodZ